MADAVAGICQISVRFVLHPRFTPGGEVLAEVGAGDVKQRANEGSPARIDPAEPGQPGASNQLQEKRLGLVVPRVAGGDLAGVKVRRAAVQKSVARPARRFLDAQMLRRGVVRDIDVVDGNRELEPGGQLAAELLVAVCGLTQTVVDVRETGQGETTVSGELTKDHREGDRIRAARDGDQQTAARRTEAVSSDGATDLLKKSAHWRGNGIVPQILAALRLASLAQGTIRLAHM